MPTSSEYGKGQDQDEGPGCPGDPITRYPTGTRDSKRIKNILMPSGLGFRGLGFRA